MMLIRLRDQRGVAALTIMLVVAVLALAGGTLIFSTLAELDINNRDRRAEAAFASAEGGLDIAANHLFKEPTWDEGQNILCLDNPLTQGPASSPCTGEVKITSPSDGQWVTAGSGRPFIVYNVYSQARGGTTVARALFARFRVTAAPILYGMVVDGNVDLNGTPDLLRESILVNGTVTSRNNLSFDWNANGLFDDPDLGWRYHKDLIASDPPPDPCIDDETGGGSNVVGCAGVYANFLIFAKNQGASVDLSQPNSDEIHYNGANPSTPLEPQQSAFPRDRDVHQRTVDPITGEPKPVVTVPTNEFLEPMNSLKNMAQSQQLYMDFRNGRRDTVQIQPQDIGATSRYFERNVVVYIEADANDSIGWKVNLIPGDPTSDMKYIDVNGQAVGPASGILVVRGGSLRLEAGTYWSGAIFVPEGTLRILGDVTCICTIYAKGFTSQGGSSMILLEPSWFQRMPAGLATVTRMLFAECEPYQPSAVCPGTT